MTISRRAAVLVATFALLTSSNLNAQATYSEKGFFCVSSSTPTASVAGTLTVHWPSLTSMTNNQEYVYFMAIVYRFNPSTGTFDPYRYLPSTANTAYPGTWFVGLAGPNGPIPYTMQGGMFFYWKHYGTLVANPTIGLPKGYYKVGEFFKWQYGATGSTWATFTQPGAAKALPVGVKGGYCTL
jgi:hypothetical protein